MSHRRLYLDSGPGELRGVVTLGGLPERLLIERTGELRGPRLGAVYRARISELATPLGLAFLDLGGGEEGVLKLPAGAGLARGATLQAEVAAEVRADKAASFRFVGKSEGKPGLLEPAPGLHQRLASFAPDAPVDTGESAREVADEAEEAVLASRHELAGGAVLTIEVTRALTVVDVDLPPGAARSRRNQGNLDAINHAARLLRLKARGGIIVIDLIGGGDSDSRLREAAREAFRPDQPGLVVLPVSRLGLLQVARPHRERPVEEVLCGSDGRLSPRTVAHRVIRDLEREGRSTPGALLEAVCSPEVALELRPLAAALGPRFAVTAQLGLDCLKTDIRQR